MLSQEGALLCQAPEPEQSSAEQGLSAGSLRDFQRGADLGGANLGSAEAAKLRWHTSLQPGRRRNGSPACKNEHLVDSGKKLAEDKLCWDQAESAALQV